MKNFILKSALWVLGLAAFMVAILYPLNPKMFTDKKEQYLANANIKNIDLLVLGSSRAQYSINPLLFDSACNVFNLGEDGHGFPSNYLMLKKLLNDYHLTVDTLLLQVDEFSFNGKKGFSRQFRDDVFFDDLQDPEVYEAFKTYRGPVLTNILKAFPNAGVLFYNDFTRFVRNYPAAVRAHISGTTPLLDPSVDTFLIRKGYVPLFDAHAVTEPAEVKHYILEQDDLFYFNKLITLCRQHHIRLVFFRAPVMFCAKEDSHLFDQYITAFCKKNSVPFYDYKCSYQNRNAYFDNTHATDKIAKLVTLDLKARMHM